MSQILPGIAASTTLLCPAAIGRSGPTVASCLLGSTVFWVSNHYKHTECPPEYQNGFLPYYESVGQRIKRLSIALGSSGLISVLASAASYQFRSISDPHATSSVKAVFVASSAQLGIAVALSLIVDTHRSSNSLAGLGRAVLPKIKLPKVNLPRVALPPISLPSINLNNHKSVAKLGKHIPLAVSLFAPALAASDRVRAAQICAIGALCMFASDKIAEQLGCEGATQETVRITTTVGLAALTSGLLRGIRDPRKLLQERSLVLLLTAQIGFHELIERLDERVHLGQFGKSVRNTLIIAGQILGLLAPAALAPSWQSGLKTCAIGLGCLALSQRAAPYDEGITWRASRLAATFTLASVVTKLLSRPFQAAPQLSPAAITRLHLAQFLVAGLLSTFTRSVQSKSPNELIDLYTLPLLLAPALFAKTPHHGLLLCGPGALAAYGAWGLQNGRERESKRGIATSSAALLASGVGAAVLAGRVTKQPRLVSASVIATQVAIWALSRMQRDGGYLARSLAQTTILIIPAGALLGLSTKLAANWPQGGLALGLSSMAGLATLLLNHEQRSFAAVLRSGAGQVGAAAAVLALSRATGSSLRSGLLVSCAQLVLWTAAEIALCFHQGVSDRDEKRINQLIGAAAAALCLFVGPVTLSKQPLHLLTASLINISMLLAAAAAAQPHIAQLNYSKITHIATSSLCGSFLITRGISYLARREWSLQTSATVASAHLSLAMLASAIYWAMASKESNRVIEKYKLLPLPNLVRALAQFAGRNQSDAESGLEGYTDTEKQTLLKWLRRLEDTANFSRGKSASTRAYAGRILDYIELGAKDTEFKGALITCAEEGTLSCGDRMALSTLRVAIVHKLSLCDPKNITELGKLYARGWWTMKLLEVEAQQKVIQLESNGGCDELEVYLGYPCLLRERLSIPIDRTDMIYRSRLTQDDLAKAEQIVRASWWGTDAFYAALVQEDRWKQALELRYPTEYTAINKRFELIPEEGGYSEESYVRADDYRKEQLTKLTARALRFTYFQSPLARLAYWITDFRRLPLTDLLT